MVCFSQFAMAGTGSCSCMASGMGVAAAASELKKNRLKRTEKRRSGWCSVQTSEPQIWLATSPSMCCCVACRSPGTFVRGPWAYSMREMIRESNGQTKQARFVASCNQILSNLFDSRSLEPSHAFASISQEGGGLGAVQTSVSQELSPINQTRTGQTIRACCCRLGINLNFV